MVDGEPTDTAKKGDRVSLIANQSPFYGESGGQIGDTGVITVPDKGRVRVTDTQKKLGDMTVHVGTVEEGEIAVGDMASLAVNARAATPSAPTTPPRTCCTRRFVARWVSM